MSTYMRIGEVARTLHVTTQSVRRYVNEGRLKSDITPGGFHTFQQSYIDEFLGRTTPEATVTVFYVRASDGDAVKMANQESALRQAYGEPLRVYKDKASGLNEKRPGLSNLLRDAQLRKFSRIAITQEDRLARFGGHYLRLLLAEHNVEVVTLYEKGDKSLQEELMQDFMSLIASFSGRFYRLRGHAQARQLLRDAENRLS